MGFGLNLNFEFEFESAHKLLMNLNLNLNSTFAKSMNLNLNFDFSKSMNLNLNLVFSKSMNLNLNLNLKIKKKMNGSNPGWSSQVHSQDFALGGGCFGGWGKPQTILTQILIALTQIVSHFLSKSR